MQWKKLRKLGQCKSAGSFEATNSVSCHLRFFSGMISQQILTFLIQFELSNSLNIKGSKMAFMWTNLRLQYIGMTEYRSSMILDFNQSYFLKNGSRGRRPERNIFMKVLCFLYNANYNFCCSPCTLVYPIHVKLYWS